MNSNSSLEDNQEEFEKLSEKAKEIFKFLIGR